jgi:hypothetical protein
MSTSTPVTALVLPEFKPYDPADSPGPFPSVIEEFRRGAWRNRPDPLLTQLARYTVVLVPPDHAEDLGLHRSTSGLMLYVDGVDEEQLRCLDSAVGYIEEQVGVEIALVEHHADLTYWTPIPRPT